MLTDQLDGGAMVATATNDVEKIQRSMADIRQRLRQDVKGVVAGAEAASDWKHYFRMAPWAAVGGAFVLGYLIVPRKRRSVHQTAEKAAELAVAKVTESADRVAAVVSTPAPAAEKKKGMIGMVFGLVAPLAVRAVQGYAMSYVENFLAMQAQGQQNVGPPPPGR